MKKLRAMPVQLVCFCVAKSVIEGQRSLHSDYVFPYCGKRIFQMNNSGWQTAWEKAGLPINGNYTKGPHNLKPDIPHPTK
jgi:hypothetical protein